MRKIFSLSLLLCYMHIAAHAQLGIIQTFAGTGVAGQSGDSGLATAAQLEFPHGLTRSQTTGLIYFTQSSGTGNNQYIRTIDPSTGIISTIAGTGTAGYGGDNGPATSATLNRPFDMVLDAFGNLYFCDEKNDRVRKIDASGTITTIAGNGTHGYGGDGVAATSVAMDDPSGIAIDATGNLYISEINRVRKIDLSSGIISTIAGSGTYSYSGDGGPASAATFYENNFLTFDNSGNLLISDNGNHCVRKIIAASGVISPSCTITLVAGTPGMPGSSGDGGLATNAKLRFPGGILVNSANDIIIVDNDNSRIRSVSSATGNITSIGGTGVAGFSGDGGPAGFAKMNTPRDIEWDGIGQYYMTDALNNRIRTADNSSFVYVCPGSCVSLTSSPGVSYSWYPTAGLSSSTVQNPVACPTITTTYTVTVTDAVGGTSTGMVTVYVAPLPPINAGYNVSISCGSSATLTATGGASYVWMPGGSTSNPFIVSPTATTTYTVTGTDVYGCTNTSSVTVTHPVSVEGGTVICRGSSTTLTASGGTTYSWLHATGLSSTTSASPVASPTVTTTYTVTASSPGCTSVGAVTVIVNTATAYTLSISQTQPFVLLDPDYNAYTYCGTSDPMELAVSSSIPSAVYSWSPAVATSAGGGVATPSPSVTTTYTVSATYGCLYKATVKVVVPPAGSCSPCSYFKVAPPTGVACSDCGLQPFRTVTASVTSALAPGNYYMNGNTFSGTLTLTNCNFYFNPSVSGPQYISATTDVTFDNCHLNSPCYWLGFDILSSGPNVGKVTFRNNTLIENAQGNSAYAAVRLVAGSSSSATSALPTGYNSLTGANSIITSDMAIFNANFSNIYMTYWPSASIAPDIMPLKVVNSVFSEADFTSYYAGPGSNASQYYPFSWPSVSDLKTISSASGSSDYVYNPFYGIDNYNTASTHFGRGLNLNGGYTDNSATPITYKGFVVGDKTDASKSNLFCNLITGVSSNANVTVYNSVFKLKYSGTPTTTDIGISSIPAQAYKFQVAVGDDGSGTETGSALGNKFFNMYTAVNATFSSANTGYYKFVGRNSAIASKGGSANGYYLSTSSFEKTLVSNNNIYNVGTGVNILPKSISGNYDYGEISVVANTLSAAGSVAIASGSTAMNQAIIVKDGKTGTILSSTDAGLINISQDTINNVYNGIDVENFTYKPFQINNNYVFLANNASSTTSQTGISSILNASTGTLYANQIMENHVKGVGYNTPSVSNDGNYLFTPAHHVDGIFVKSSATSSNPITIKCNHVHETNVGYSFISASSLQWANNVMYHNKYGMYLQGNIGQQGNSTNPIDNWWEDDGTGWWTSGNGYPTMVSTVSPGVAASGNSEMYIRSGSDNYPSSTTRNLGTATGKYTYGTSYNVVSTPPGLPDCTGQTSGGDLFKFGGGSDEETITERMPSNRYTILPNPNQGTFTFVQGIVVDGEVHIRVMSALGSIVYDNSLFFTSGQTRLSLDYLNPGLYVIELTDKNGERSVVKMSVQK